MPEESHLKSPPWFRFYSETLDDFKLKRVGMRIQQHRMFVIGAWAALLALANSSPERGSLLIAADLPYTVEDIALRIDLDSEMCNALLEAFIANKMIHLDNGVYIISNWDNRQFTTDNSNERVRRYREKRKALDLPIAPKYDNNVIWDRDNRRCVYCDGSKNLCVDHVYPIDLGGTDHYDNLVTACKACNSGKAGRTPEQAGYKFINQQAQTRYQSYINNVITMRNTVTVTVTPPESESDTESDTDSLSAPPTPAIPSKKPQDKIASPKEQGLFLILARLCRIDLKTAPLPKQIGQLDDTVKALLPAIKDCTFFAVKFETYWTTVDWRGKQGQPPTPPQIREVYGDYCYWLEHGEKRATSGGNGSTPPPPPISLTPEQKAAARALNSDHQAAVAETTQRVNGLLAAGVKVAGVDVDRELRKPIRRGEDAPGRI